MINKFLVGGMGEKIVIMRPTQSLSYDEAIELAAWLTALAEPFASRKFEEVLKEVRST